jgi:hypothetical protein
VRYCSKTCQSKAWKREHKYECKAIAPQDRPDLPHGVRAVIKLLGRLQADPQGKDEQLIDILRFQPYADEGLLAAMKKAKPQRCEDFDMLAYGAWKYAGEPKIGDVDSLGLAKGFFYNVGRLNKENVSFLLLANAFLLAVGDEQYHFAERDGGRLTRHRLRSDCVQRKSLL